MLFTESSTTPALSSTPFTLAPLHTCESCDFLLWSTKLLICPWVIVIWVCVYCRLPPGPGCQKCSILEFCWHFVEVVIFRRRSHWFETETHVLQEHSSHHGSESGHKNKGSACVQGPPGPAGPPGPQVKPQTLGFGILLLTLDSVFTIQLILLPIWIVKWRDYKSLEAKVWGVRNQYIGNMLPQSPLQLDSSCRAGDGDFSGSCSTTAH